MIQSEQMVTVSLIVNELVQNVFDHAFKAEQKGSVLIRGYEKQRLIYISVEDNGNGYDLKATNTDSLGLMIVSSYVKDKLKGKIKIESNEQGTKTCFYFEKNIIDAVRR
ncbi:ATPase/histidine kinase/DNA gyrase B/HSP90 domain protein [Enterococcus canis]|uniref:histidine kinase n=2 Tax=Enterococcus canis TaxID=214095 RepID=A0A1L8RI44_9ENTE|nr:ATPase/histidine kinase/DNA gyrase B/HSP90 domain protein [Enterococcus canis]